MGQGAFACSSKKKLEVQMIFNFRASPCTNNLSIAPILFIDAMLTVIVQREASS